MRFKASIKNINVFLKIVASLGLLAKVAWVRLDHEHIRFTVIPEHGSQVWATIMIESIFDDDDFTIQSAANNTINLEVPLDSLQRALKSAQNAASVSIRLTKKDGAPLLSLTVAIPTPLTSSGRPHRSLDSRSAHSNALPGTHGDSFTGVQDLTGDPIAAASFESSASRETTITQDVAIRVLAAATVEGIYEPSIPEPEVHILLPPLIQLKAISERFTKLGLASTKIKTTGLQGGNMGPKLELSANMHGELKLGIRTDALNIQSKWQGLSNPELDPETVAGGSEEIANHPSTRMRGVVGEEGWATVRVDARDWGRVLGVGRIGGRVIACFCDEKALILYVYLPNEESNGVESVLTYYISCYSA